MKLIPENPKFHFKDFALATFPDGAVLWFIIHGNSLNKLDGV